jgi:hypothetical protein
MILPVDLGELSILLAVTAIILLVTSELISSNTRASILLDRKKLRRVAIVFSVLFLVIVGVRILEIASDALAG